MLNREEIKSLETEGFLSLGKLLSKTHLVSIIQRIEELHKAEGEYAGSELFDSKYIRHPKETGADRLADLVNKGKVFDIFYTHPRVLAGIEAVLGEQFKLSSLNYRAAKPGQGNQKLHVDWKNGVPNRQYKVCNSLWLLEDFTEVNGATRVVPGTHKLNTLPDDVMEDTAQSHPDEILITAPAGSVFIFNSHVWHGGTTNKTTEHRRSIHSYFCTMDQPQQIDQKRYITDETRRRIGKKAEKILDVI